MADANNPSDHSLLWGRALEFWDRVGIWALIAGAGLGVAALIVTTGSAYVLYRVADEAQVALSKESKSSAERIAELNRQTAKLGVEAESARAAISKANAEAAKANARTAEIYATFSARRLSDSQKWKLQQSLNGTDFKIWLRYEPDPEVIALQNDLAYALSGTNPQVLVTRETTEGVTPWLNGILIANTDLAKARTLQKILIDSGLESSIVEWWQIPRRMPFVPLEIMAPEDRSKEIRNEPVPGITLLFIGRKPIPQAPEPQVVIPDSLRKQFPDFPFPK